MREIVTVKPSLKAAILFDSVRLSRSIVRHVTLKQNLPEDTFNFNQAEHTFTL